jgi:hypothetical protein
MLLYLTRDYYFHAKMKSKGRMFACKVKNREEGSTGQLEEEAVMLIYLL